MNLSTRDPRMFFEEARAYFRPRSEVLPSEWATRDRFVSAGDFKGARWTWDVTPYLEEIVDFAYAPTSRRAVVMKSTRVGYTQGVLANIVGYSVVEDPCSVLVMLNNDEAWKIFAKTQMIDVIRSTPVLRRMLGETPDMAAGRMRGDQTHGLRMFPGGRLEIKGAKDASFRSQEFRRVLADEIDDWFVRRSTAEGDPIKRLERRTNDYHDGFVLAGSSPRLTTNLVWPMWLRSDQRKWFVPCPECGEFQVIEWERIEWPKRVVCCGVSGLPGEPCQRCKVLNGPKSKVRHLADRAWYRCVSCEAEIPETKKGAMVRAGEWRPTARGRYPGWHLSALFSLINNARWEVVVREYLEAKAELKLRGDDSRMRVWKQTLLGLPWEEHRSAGDAEDLEGRAETYGHARDGSALEIPPGVGVLTAAVDVHDRWSEVLVRGWGVGGESWDVAHQRLRGSPARPETWAAVDRVLMRGYRAAGGRTLQVQLCLVDSGSGGHTDEVYRYCRSRVGVYPSKGDQGYTGRPLAKFSGSAKGQAVELVNIGTMTGKDQLFHRLSLTYPGPGYIHLRTPDRRICNGFDREYFEQFRAERRETEMGKRPKWIQTRERNEAVDLQVMNSAAFALLGLPDAELERLAEEAQADPPKERKVVTRSGQVHPGYGRGGVRLPQP